MATLVKFTRGNQLTIPKRVLEQSGLDPTKDYVSVEYVKGMILLKPVDIEERIPSHAYEKLLDQAFEIEKGDVVVGPREAKKVLAKRRK